MTDKNRMELFRVEIPSEMTDELRTIYEEAFPPDEKREWSQVIELLNNTNYILYELSEQKRTIGMLSVWNLVEFNFIEHFAIRSEDRSKGFGTEIIQSLLKNSPLPFILEVELPIDDASKKRIEFYEKFGFGICKGEYFQPPYSVSKNRVKMLLMRYPEITNGNDFNSEKTKILNSVYNFQ